MKNIIMMHIEVWKHLFGMLVYSIKSVSSLALCKPWQVVPMSNFLKFSGSVSSVLAWSDTARARAISGWMGGEKEALCLQVPFTKMELKSESFPELIIFKYTSEDLHLPLFQEQQVLVAEKCFFHTAILVSPL